MTVKKHIHKLLRYKYKTGNDVYFCTLDCTFKIECAFALGKVSICNLCGREFQLTESSIKLKRPHCSDCSKVKVVNPITGKKEYVRKEVASRQREEIVLDMASDSNRELQNRLARVIQESLDEDIV